jgi:WXG100 family type VII secretion target
VTSGVNQTTAEAAGMVQAAAEFDRINSSMQSMLKTLMSELEELHAGWAGEGAQAFYGVKDQWARDQQAISNALTETAQSIRDSGRGYDATDSAASSRMAASNHGLQLPL